MAKPNILIVTNGGGAGVQASDTLVEMGLEVREPPGDLQEELASFLPSYASTRNPIDLTGGAPADWFRRALIVALRHPWPDAILVLYTETGLSGPVETAKAILDALREAGRRKPLTVALLGGPGCLHAARLLTLNRVPAYPTPERAAKALAFIALYLERREFVRRRLERLGLL